MNIQFIKHSVKTGFVFLGVLLATTAFGQDPVLFSVNGKDVLKSEFDYIYSKNNGENADYSKESVEEYLDLYVKFKLKVAKARQLQLDTIPSLIQELAGYRKQLASSYLVDKELSNKLIEEAYVRKQRDLRVNHLLVSLPEGASKAAEAKALEKIWRIKGKVNQGANFDVLAKTLSEDKASAISGGSLGWMTSLLPDGFYGFETAIYNTPVGAVTDPVRTGLGYHLIKVMEERPALGEMEIAHILVRNKRKGQLIPDAKAKVDSLHQLLMSGTNFELLAINNSEDKNTAPKGGDLGFFGISQYEKSFEDAAFSLNNNGDFTEPVLSSIGWHIIMRKSIKDMADEEKFKRGLSSLVSKSDRYEIAKISMIEQIKTEAKFEDSPEVLSRFVSQLNNQFYSYKWEIPAMADKTICAYGDSFKYSVNDFAAFCKKNTRQRLRFDKKKPVENAVQSLYEQFVTEKTLAYQEAHLEEKYPDFKALMREYEEGILLFEATRMHVWDKAGKDTVGLKKFYEGHKNRYTWNERGILSKYTISTLDKDMVKKLRKAVDKKSSKEILSEFNAEIEMLKYSTTTHELGSKEFLGLDWKAGKVSNPIEDEESKVTLIKKLETILPAGQKTMLEARGYIIADYQDELEKVWINELTKEFAVKRYEEIIKSLYK